jgi:DNA mismatch endonuclease (patch repair protein)
MADTLTQEARSERMALIRGANTGPELLVRRIVHAMGFRYRLHVKTLPGKPDLVFPRLGKIVLVQGCFWHRHRKPSCKLARLPKNRLDFWQSKLDGNRRRDQETKRLLRKAGWRVLEVWECEMQNIDSLRGRLRYFLEDEIA